MEQAIDLNNFDRLRYLKSGSVTSPTQNFGSLGTNVGFQRDIYLPSSPNFDGDRERRMQYAEKGIDKKGKSVEDKKEESMGQKEKENIPKLIRHFFGYTTAHGMNRLADAKGIFWKVFWSLVCLGSFGMFAFQAHGLLVLFFSKPVSTNVRITFEKQVPFPAVTICNLNMLRTNKVPDSLKKDLAKEYDSYNATEDISQIRVRRGISIGTTAPPPPTTDAPTSSPSSTSSHSSTEVFTGEEAFTPHHQTTSSPSSTFSHSNTEVFTGKESLTPYYKTTSSSHRYHSTSHFTRYPTSWYRDYTDGKNYGYYYGNDGKKPIKYYDRELLPSVNEVDNNTLFLERFTTFVTRVPEAQLLQAGHQFHDFVTNCTWRGLDCKTGNFSKWWYQNWNYKYGNCFTFNGGKDKDNNELRVLSTSKPGPAQGLLLQLNIEQEKYLQTVSTDAGVRVILHDQGVMAFPFEEGFSVSPGMSTSVGIQKTVIGRVDRFNNNSCWEEDELDEKNIYRIFYNVTKYTKQTCQNSCLGKTQFEECGCSEYSYPSGQPACDAFNETIRECLSFVHVKFNNDILPCVHECRQPCKEEIIQKTISMSQWPSMQYEVHQKGRNGNFSAKSSVVLNVFYNELNYYRIEEAFTYNVINLLADIGGQLGLWIGVSAITCVETLELFMLIAALLVRKCRGKVRTNEMELP